MGGHSKFFWFKNLFLDILLKPLKKKAWGNYLMHFHLHLGRRPPSRSSMFFAIFVLFWFFCFQDNQRKASGGHAMLFLQHLHLGRRSPPRLHHKIEKYKELFTKPTNFQLIELEVHKNESNYIASSFNTIWYVNCYFR